MSIITDADLTNTLKVYHNTVVKPLDTRVKRLKSFHTSARYGIRIDQSNSGPDASVTYLYDAVGKTPAGLDANNVFDYGDWQDFVYDICKPVMLNPDGTVKYELDRDDQRKKVDGTASEYNNTTQTANMMVQFKKMYLSVTEPETNIIEVVFSSSPIDSTYKAYPFIDTNGNQKDFAYYSMYRGTSSNSKIRSLASGQSYQGIASNHKTQCTANGSGWGFQYYSLKNYINLLHVLISKSLNAQTKFGRGVVSTSGSKSNVGVTVNSGAFYGNKSAGNVPVKSFYIEDFWGNCWTLCEGVMVCDSKMYYKSTPPYLESKSDIISNYTDTSVTKTHSNVRYIRKMKVVDGALFPCDNTNGSTSTYWCDADDNRSYQASYDPYWLITGSNCWDGDNAGLFYAYQTPISSGNDAMVASRLAYV